MRERSGTSPTSDTSIGTAVAAVRSVRGRARQFWQVFDCSLVPMVIVDNDRRYLAANGAARLVFRLSLEEVRSRRIEDLTPQHMFGRLHERWARLVRDGAVSGLYDVGFPDGSELRIVYCALANVLPAQHLFVFMPADWPGDELSVVPDAKSPPAPVAISAREREVLSLIAAGAGIDDIADELTISAATVRTHTRNALRKLGAHNRAHAIALAMCHGLIDLPVTTGAAGIVSLRYQRERRSYR